MLTDGNIDHASARIRALEYIPFFENVGYRVDLIPRVPQRPSDQIGKFLIFPLLKRWYNVKMVLFILLKHWDVVFIQRTFISRFLLNCLSKRSTSIIYDFDDAIYINPNRPRDLERTALMVGCAAQVIVSTDYLTGFCLQYGQKPEVIPSPVETDRIRPAKKQSEGIPTIGWIGSPWTSGFLELVEKPLQQLALKHEFRFLTVGAASDYVVSGIFHQAEPWVFEDENNQLGKMDIGIMPLPDTDYTRMKGGYKLLQYFAAGIPCVASPVGINQTIVKPGENGFLASNDEEWFRSLEKLILDSQLRSILGKNGRKEATELYSRDVCFQKLLAVVECFK